MEGWVKFHRKMLENPIICKDAETFAIWGYLLLSATHKEYTEWFGGKKIALKPGQLIVGRKKIAEVLRVSESKVQRTLKRFEDEHQIEQQTSNANRLITIVSWESYQYSERQTEQPVNSQRTTSEQPVNTYKNERMKECKKETYSASDEADSFAEQCAMIRDLYNSVCGSYPRLVKLSEKRKKAIRARMNSGYSVLDFKTLFEKAEQSRFLKGGNDRNWTADFDWLITDKYMPRVLEGKYDDALQQQKSKASNKFNNFQGRSYDMDSLERQLQGK